MRSSAYKVSLEAGLQSRMCERLRDGAGQTPSICHLPAWFTKMANRPHLYQPLALFVPNSAGDSNSLLKLTLQSINQTFPFLSHLLDVVGRAKLTPVPIEQL